jgi:hypothetical protein
LGGAGDFFLAISFCRSPAAMAAASELGGRIGDSRSQRRGDGPRTCSPGISELAIVLFIH